MKTTVDLPDELLREAKKVAVDRDTSLRELVIRGLEHEIHTPPNPCQRIEWVTSPGSLKAGWDLSDREKMLAMIHSEEQ